MLRPKMTAAQRDYLRKRIDEEKRRRRRIDWLLQRADRPATIALYDDANSEGRVEEMADIGTVAFPIDSKAVKDPEVADLVESMSAAIVAEEWRGDNKPHKTKKEAANISQLLRRHVAAKLGVPEKQVRSRVRDLSGGKDESKGQWVWGLRLRENGTEPTAETTEEG